MKKLIVAIILAAGSYYTAGAQTLQITIYDLTHFNSTLPDEQSWSGSCETTASKVCHINSGRRSCYKTAYAENFKVCKGNRGYFICCESPGTANATHPGFTVVTPGPEQSYTPPSVTDYQLPGNRVAANENTSDENEGTPESQSYPSSADMVRESAYLGNYPQKHYIRVCYIGDNVAENNRNPYRGCPSPQYDGPQKNLERNINVSTPNANAPLAPITGKNGF